MTRKSKLEIPQSPVETDAKEPASASKLDRLQTLLRRDEGASIEDMIATTGWQAHSVRGALAGALKRRGFAVTSQKVEGVRRYRGSAE